MHIYIERDNFMCIYTVRIYRETFEVKVVFVFLQNQFIVRESIDWCLGIPKVHWCLAGVWQDTQSLTELGSRWDGRRADIGPKS